MEKIQINNSEFIEKKEGCKLRSQIHKDIKKITNENYNYQKTIDKNKGIILEKLAKDNELANAGFCKIDKQLENKNILTGSTQSVSYTHQNECITLDRKGLPETINDLVICSEENLKNNIVYKLEEKLKSAGYEINSFNDLLDNLEIASIEKKKKTSQKILVGKLINKGVL